MVGGEKAGGWRGGVTSRGLWWERMLRGVGRRSCGYFSAVLVAALRPALGGDSVPQGWVTAEAPNRRVAVSACSHAWYEDRVSGLACTWVKPSSMPIAASSRNSSGV